MKSKINDEQSGHQDSQAAAQAASYPYSKYYYHCNVLRVAK